VPKIKKYVKIRVKTTEKVHFQKIFFKKFQEKFLQKF